MKSVYNTLDADTRQEFYRRIESDGAELYDGIDFSRSGAFAIQIAPNRGAGSLFAYRDEVDRIAAEYGLSRLDFQLLAGHHTDDPKWRWYGSYNLPPDPPAYLAVALYGPA